MCKSNRTKHYLRDFFTWRFISKPRGYILLVYFTKSHESDKINSKKSSKNKIKTSFCWKPKFIFLLLQGWEVESQSPLCEHRNFILKHIRANFYEQR